MTSARLLGLLLCGLLSAKPALAAEVRVAVAANFTAAAKEIGELFAAASGHRARFSFGGTGQLYAQISQGAPFEVFLAADQARPARAIAAGLAVPGTQVTYATGRLVLFSREAGLVIGPETLREGRFARLAIANPATAPYGAAAVAVLRGLGLDERLAPRLVRGGNIAQTHQFVATGNAELGFVALSQVVGHQQGSRWLVPQPLHPPIAQDAVLLQQGAERPAARAFLAFLQGEQAAAVKRRYGYGSAD
jgi:molybdate transport system substrate-binding protein